MSSADTKIPLRHKPDDIGYRLIELPPELQSLLESDNPPVLTLESSETSALLKSPDRTYSLRQKNTSNSVILLSPLASSTSSNQGIAAISTIHETVELELVPEHAAAASGQLKNTGSRGKWHEMFGKGR
ncbi:hypothetical protein ACSS6W_007412 [Trichoderma asperelloides]|nr:hypothetical protein LI328DRAFT_125180 [Trichoderma asperelloides]